MLTEMITMSPHLSHHTSPSILTKVIKPVWTMETSWSTIISEPSGPSGLQEGSGSHSEKTE